jgi:thiamine biosynthesis protein ThiS
MPEPEQINVTANGSSFSIPSNQPLEEFLMNLGFAPELVVVERNLQAISPGERGFVHLQEGDRLEIVRIVAGG